MSIIPMAGPEPCSIDLSKAIGMAEAAALVRGMGGRAPHVETMRRWATKGVRVNGELVRLRTIKLNSERITLPEWVRAFEEERLRLAMAQAPVSRTEGEARAAHERAEVELAARGVGRRQG
jgi:hypothetical protein